MRRPFDTRSRLRQLNLTFFTDRDLGKTVPRLLRENGLTVEWYFDHFREGVRVADNEWLKYVSERRWVAISHDKNIRRDSEAIRTIMENSGRLFILRGKLPMSELASMFLQAEDSIADCLVDTKTPFIANIRRTVYRKGVLRAAAQVMLTLSDWRAGQLPAVDEEEDPDSA